VTVARRTVPLFARAAAFAAAYAVSLAAAPALAAQGPAQQAALAAAIPVQQGATIDRDSVTVGDVVRLTVRVRAPLGATINFPAGADSLGPVQSLEPPRIGNGSDSVSAVDRIAVYRVAAWDVGALAIRLGEVLVQTDEGERHIALTLPTLVVRSVLPADSALRIPKPARALIAIPATVPWWWWVAGALAALAIGWVLWWWRRRRASMPGLVGDPYADAERDFQRVETLGLVAAGESGRYAVLMTDVLRRYLAARLAPVTLAQTSGELLHALRGVATVSHDRLGSLFATVDRVKFAAAPLTADAARGAGADARALVRDEHERAAALAAEAAAAAAAAPAAPGARREAA
jgi:hypothetical protein